MLQLAVYSSPILDYNCIIAPVITSYYIEYWAPVTLADLEPATGNNTPQSFKVANIVTFAFVTPWILVVVGTSNGMCYIRILLKTTWHIECPIGRKAKCPKKYFFALLLSLLFYETH